MLNLKILTPEQEIFSGEVEEIVATTRNGEIGILPDHENLVTSLVPGELKIIQKGKAISLAIGEGLLKIEANQAVITTDLAIEASEIDEKAVEEALKKLEEDSRKPLAERRLPEYGSDKDFQLLQALNQFKGKPVLVSKTQVERKEEKKEN